MAIVCKAPPQDFNSITNDQKILIYTGSNNYEGREIYCSGDAEQALKHWLRTRDKTKRYLFYGGLDKPLSYVAAWQAMRKTLERAGTGEKDTEYLANLCICLLWRAANELRC